MKKPPPASAAERSLRQQAEGRLTARSAPAGPPLNEADTHALVHELQVHQIELELQNEELQRAKAEAEEAADRYTELFDFAPVGYFVLDRRGLVAEVNLVGAAMLGLDRGRVEGQPFEQFVVPERRVRFSGFCCAAEPGEARRSCEVRLLTGAHGPRDVLVEAVAVESAPGLSPGCRLAVTDISERKSAEEALRRAHEQLEQRVRERTEELSRANDELTRFNRGMVGRELRMVELKREINELCRQAGQPERYPLYPGQGQPTPGEP
jgi:PAS domain S-box-containing protein